MGSSTRGWIIVFLGFLGLTLAYAIRMVAVPAFKTAKRMYGWSDTQYGLLIAGFYCGYLILQIPGGHLSHRFGPKWIIVISLLTSAVFNVFIPFIGDSVFWAFVFRFLTGGIQGMYWVSLLNIIPAWIRRDQVSLAVSLALAGQHFGTGLIQGIYLPLVDAFTYRGPFVILLGATVLWSIVWAFVAESKPLTGGEKSTSTSNPITFMDSVRSKAVWAFVIFLFCYNWSFYFMVSFLAKFFEENLRVQEEVSGMYALAAFTLLCLTLTLGGKVTSVLIAKQYNVRKVRNVGVLVGILPAVIGIFLMCFLYKSASVTTLALLLISSIAISGFAHGACMSNPADLNPLTPGIIAGLGNTIATIPGIIAPAFSGMALDMGHCKDDGTSLECWYMYRFLFIFAACVYLFGMCIWLLFSSGTALSPIRPLRSSKI